VSGVVDTGFYTTELSEREGEIMKRLRDRGWVNRPRAVRFALVVVIGAIVLSQSEWASAAGPSSTSPNFGGGADAPLVYSPAAACFGADLNHLIGFELDGLMHVNRTGSDTTLHVVSHLAVAFYVRDVFTGAELYTGHGSVSVNDFIEMNFSPDSGYVSRTLPIDMVAPDGSSVRTLWTIEIWAGLGESESTYAAFGWGPGGVACA
jgi:hypothetical protein